MKICKAKDTKLVVQPVIGIMVHEYVFEGPCRFGEGDALTLEFDRMVGADGFQAFRKNLAQYILENAVTLDDCRQPCADMEQLLADGRRSSWRFLPRNSGRMGP